MKLRSLLVVILLSLLSVVAHAQDLPGSLTGWRAGFAKAVITPARPLWLAGYANRTKPAQGKLTELYAKACALEDNAGKRVVIVTSDLLGWPRELADEIAAQVQQRFGLTRAQLVLNASHTHTGPMLRGYLGYAYNLDAKQLKLIDDYSTQLPAQMVLLVGRALADLSPAKLSYGVGTARFGVNRRLPTPEGIKNGVNLKGPVDYDVPVLRVEAPEGQLRGVLFGYACHNTTLTGEFLQYSGDYAGFAQAALETLHPGATALFVMGAGADVNPHPRSALDIAKEHGMELAYGVEQVLRTQMPMVRGSLQFAFARVSLPLVSPTRAEFEARLKDQNVFRRRHAEYWLARLKRDGKLPAAYDYAVQVLRLGDQLTFAALGGEVVVDYALRLKRELGENFWLAGYSHDFCAYIPSERVLREGGYEGGDAMIFFPLPGPWVPGVEEKIVGKVRELLKRVGRRAGKSAW